MTDKVTRIGDLVIDRTLDCPYPGWPDADYTKARRECPTCGRRQIVMINTEAGAKLRPPVASWFWWCGGCGRDDHGGVWHPRTKEEFHYSRWQAAQEDSDG
jgi:ssDNA-binding Zn-finger/Zn-ribbon topoisomerase 1